MREIMLALGLGALLYGSLLTHTSEPVAGGTPCDA